MTLDTILSQANKKELNPQELQPFLNSQLKGVSKGRKLAILDPYDMKNTSYDIELIMPMFELLKNTLYITMVGGSGNPNKKQKILDTIALGNVNYSDSKIVFVGSAAEESAEFVSPELFGEVPSIVPVYKEYAKIYDDLLTDIRPLIDEYNDLLVEYNKYISVSQIVNIAIQTSSQAAFFITNYVSKDIRWSLQEIISSKGDKFTRYHDPNNKSYFKGWSQWQKDDINAIGHRTFEITTGDLDKLPLGTPVGNDIAFNTFVPRMTPNNSWTVFTRDINISGLPECMRKGSEENPKDNGLGDINRYIIKIERNEYGYYGSETDTIKRPMTEQQTGVLDLKYNGINYTMRWEGTSKTSLKWSLEEDVPRYYYTRTGQSIEGDDGKETILWRPWSRHDNVASFKDLGGYTVYELEKNNRSMPLSVDSLFNSFNQPQNTTYTISIFDPIHKFYGAPFTLMDEGPPIKFLGIGSNFDPYITRKTNPPSVQRYTPAFTKRKLPSRIYKELVDTSSIYFKLTYTKNEVICSCEFKDLGNMWNFIKDIKDELPYDELNSLSNLESVSNQNRLNYNRILGAEDTYKKNYLNFSSQIYAGNARTSASKQFYTTSLAGKTFLEDFPLPYNIRDNGSPFVYYKAGRIIKGSPQWTSWSSIDPKFISIESRLMKIEFMLGQPPGMVYFQVIMPTTGHNGGKYYGANSLPGDSSYRNINEYNDRNSVYMENEIDPTIARRLGISVYSGYINGPKNNNIDQGGWPMSFWGRKLSSSYADVMEQIVEKVKKWADAVNIDDALDKLPSFESRDICRKGAVYGLTVWSWIEELISEAYLSGVIASFVTMILMFIRDIIKFIDDILEKMKAIRITVWTWCVHPLKTLAEIVGGFFFGLIAILIKAIIAIVDMVKGGGETMADHEPNPPSVGNS